MASIHGKVLLGVASMHGTNLSKVWISVGRTVSRVNTSLSVGGGYHQPSYSGQYNYPGYSAPALDRSGL